LVCAAAQSVGPSPAARRGDMQTIPGRPRGIYGKQSGDGSGVPRCASFLSCQCHSTDVPNSTVLQSQTVAYSLLPIDRVVKLHG
jgi:hypothetical protein